jgi:signal transduction histidine kinase
MRIEGDYVVIRDGLGRIAGHFGVQRDVTDGYEASARVSASRMELRALTARLQRVREEERTAIAREIHDEFGQELTGIKLDILRMKQRHSHDDELSSHFQSLVERIDGTLDTVRRIATELRPGVLDRLGLDAAVEWLGYDFARRTGLVVDFDVSRGDSNIPKHVASSAFRILQESLTNVARHAHARRVVIRLNVTRRELALQITDDGIGIPSERLDGTESLGLVGMRERAFGCGGELRIISNPTSGTTVLLTVPLV